MQKTRRPGPSVRVRVTEYAAAGDGFAATHREDRLATEEPLEVRLAWPGRAAHRVAVTMRTPGHDFELATGLLHAEGALVPGQVDRVAYCTDADLAPEQEFNVVTVTLGSAPQREPGARAGTVTAAASACGVCGADSIADVQELSALAGAAATPLPRPLSPAVLAGLPERLRGSQRVFDTTGGLHAAGLFDSAGTLLALREDVGRHNAVDKVVGARLLDGSTGAPLGGEVLVVSGRIGFEIVQKAVVAGAGALAAIGAPSSLAADLAADAGLTLVGFLSARRFVVYTGAERLGV